MGRGHINEGAQESKVRDLSLFSCQHHPLHFEVKGKSRISYLGSSNE